VSDAPTLAELLRGAPRKAPSRKDGGWYAWFGRRIKPREASRLEALSHQALALLHSGEAWTLSLSMREAITSFTGGVTPQELSEPRHARLLREVMREFDGQDEDLHDLYPWRPHELLGLASARDVPGLDPTTPLSETDLADIAEAIFTRAAEAEGGSTDESDAEAQWIERAPRAAPVRLQEDLRRRAKVAPVSIPTSGAWPSLAGVSPQERVTVIDRETAFAFCRAHHTQLPDPRTQGFLIAIGLRVGGVLRGVAIGSTPSGPARKGENKYQRHVVEVSRIVTDDEGGRGSIYGASSLLMRWFMIHADDLVRPYAEAPALVVTFSLLTETGATYAALVPEGLHAADLTEPHAPSGARAGSEAGKKEVWKIRWEAGEDARPHVPHLLQLYRAYTAVHEGRPLTLRHFLERGQKLLGLDTRAGFADLARVLGFPAKTIKNMSMADIKQLLLKRFGAAGAGAGRPGALDRPDERKATGMTLTKLLALSKANVASAPPAPPAPAPR